MHSRNMYSIPACASGPSKSSMNARSYGVRFLNCAALSSWASRASATFTARAAARDSHDPSGKSLGRGPSWERRFRGRLCIVFPLGDPAPHSSNFILEPVWHGPVLRIGFVFITCHAVKRVAQFELLIGLDQFPATI